MDKAKRARTAETLKQPSLGLKLRAPYLYPDPGYTSNPCSGAFGLRSATSSPPRSDQQASADDAERASAHHAHQIPPMSMSHGLINMLRPSDPGASHNADRDCTKALISPAADLHRLSTGDRKRIKIGQ